jgi:hypothetical protein
MSRAAGDRPMPDREAGGRQASMHDRAGAVGDGLSDAGAPLKPMIGRWAELQTAHDER